VKKIPPDVVHAKGVIIKMTDIGWMNPDATSAWLTQVWGSFSFETHACMGQLLMSSNGRCPAATYGEEHHNGLYPRRLHESASSG
jgi:hypothetical protein